MRLLNKAAALLALIVAMTSARQSIAQNPAGAQGPAAAQNQAAPIAPAPAADPAAGDDIAVFRAGTQLVDLPVSVLDKNGKPISGIPQSAFKVYENNIEQPIKVFRSEDQPVSIGIIIDNSGSMRDKRARVAAAALALVKNSNPQDEEFIVDFNDDVYLDQPFTSDIKKLEIALGRIDMQGGTAMRDAISTSIDYMKEKATRDRKVLLVVTDGNDNTSNIDLEPLVRKAQASEVLIYCIGLLSEEDAHDRKSAQRALKDLAEASGGQDYYPKDLAEVEKITPEVAHEIRNQYILAYSPTNTALDGTFRQIRVKLTGYGSATVRTRNGYYASPASSRKPSGVSFK
ncbi:MAG TPA: VWA domain-containing protein [Bryobacteraceae bacterium]|jgi:VWFA-related protein